MLRVTFLGTSGSVPTIERGMPAIALKYESELMLFDCGEGTQRQLMKYKVGYGSVDCIFITHSHLDHYLGMFGLLETLRLSSPSPRPLRIFIPKALDIGEYAFAKLEKIRAGEVYRGRGFSIGAFQVRHTRGSYGFVFQEEDRVKFHEEKAHSLGLSGRMFKEIQAKGRVKTSEGEVLLEDVTWVKKGRKIVYAGDCLPDENTIEAARGADLLIHEATFDSSKKEEAAERFHSTSEDAARVAKSAGVKRLVLTHISPRYSDASELLSQARAIFSDCEVAQDGQSYDI